MNNQAQPRQSVQYSDSVQKALPAAQPLAPPVPSFNPAFAAAPNPVQAPFAAGFAQQQAPRPPQAPAHFEAPPRPGAQLVTPAQAVMPMLVPQNYVQPGTQVPAYLTVPEPYSQNVFSMMFSSILRAGLKGMFVTAANMMDHIPWGR